MPNAGIIIGQDSLCIGETVIYTDSIHGGTWLSKYPTIATIGGGYLHAYSSGIDTVFYTVKTSCGVRTVSKNIFIKSNPYSGTITGKDSLCIGEHITLYDSISGGVWRVTNSKATVSTGIVEGINVGIDTVFYIVTNTCGSDTSKHRIVIGTFPNAGTITGNMQLCIGNADTFTDTVVGGIWGSFNESITSIDSTSGILHANAYGVDTIRYTFTNRCGTDSSFFIVSIDSVLIPLITGRNFACAGGRNDTFSGTPANGIWSVSNTNANINTDGVVIGATEGFVLVTYSINNYCGYFVYVQPIFVQSMHECDSILYTDALTLITNFKIYPNPSTGVFNIESPVIGIMEISVTDLIGKEVYIKETEKNNHENVEFDLSYMNSGTYFVRMKSGNYLIRRKITIIR